MNASIYFIQNNTCHATSRCRIVLNMKKEKGKAKLGRRPIDNYGSRTNIVTGVIGAETLRLLNLHKKKKAVSRIRAVSDIIRDRMHHDGREFNAC